MSSAYSGPLHPGTVAVTCNAGPGGSLAGRGDGTYVGWCLEDDFLDDPPDGERYPLVDSTDDPANFPTPCEYYDQIPWDRVNYLLNAASPEVIYPYSEDEVRAMVQFAYTAGAFEDTKSLFAAANEGWCQLN